MFASRTRPLTAIAIGTAALAVLVPAGQADAKKKKKPVPLTATVNGTFTLAHDRGGFGNDDGPDVQNLSVEIKDAKIPFAKGNTQSAGAKVKIRVKHDAHAHTDDRSWHAGCDIEERTAVSSWTGDAVVGLRETNWRQTDGTSKKYLGWTVTPTIPTTDMIVISGGFYQDWESILMDTCVTYGMNTPLGWWSPAFGTPDGMGKLNDDRTGIILNTLNTDSKQTGTAKGTVKFNKPLPKQTSSLGATGP